MINILKISLLCGDRDKITKPLAKRIGFETGNQHRRLMQELERLHEAGLSEDEVMRLVH